MSTLGLAARTQGLSELVASRLSRAGGGLGTGLSAGLSAMLALGMVIVRHADGPDAFLQGVVARGVTLHLVLASLPFALAVARTGKTWPGEPGLTALAEQRGFSEADVAALVPGVAMRVAAQRCVRVCAPLAAIASLFALPDGQLALRRLVATALLVLLGALSAAGLAGLAALFAGRARRGAGVAFSAVFLVPWLCALAIPAVPLYASFPGAYDALRGRILDASGR